MQYFLVLRKRKKITFYNPLQTKHFQIDTSDAMEMRLL
jgi:hypothetical protein